MSFATPLVLLGLLALPVLIWLYLREQRRRAAALELAVSAPLLGSLAPRRPGWRRHAPYLLLGLGIGVLIISAAGPRHTVSRPLRSASVMLLNDVSASMSAGDVRPSRLVAAKRAATSFLDGVGPGIRVGSIVFARHATVLQAPTSDHALTRSALARIRSGGGGTAMGAALALGLAFVRPHARRGAAAAPGSLILISDGGANVGPDPVAVAAHAGREHVPIYTVAVGTAHGEAEIPYRHGERLEPVPVQPLTLARIAHASGGRPYRAADAATVSAIYRQLATTLSHRRVEASLAGYLAGAGLVALALAVALSLNWFGWLA